MLILINVMLLLQAPFANKGPKWYLNLAKKCKYGNTRDNAWSKLEQNIKTLINLGESSEAVIKRILNLTCIEISAKQKAAAAAAVTGAPPLPRNVRTGAPRNSRDLKAAVYLLYLPFTLFGRAFLISILKASQVIYACTQNSLADLGKASFNEEVLLLFQQLYPRAKHKNRHIYSKHHMSSLPKC